MENTDDLELKDLGQYYGTENYYGIMGVNVTDGIKYIMANGYSWFVTDMIAVIICSQKEYPKVYENREFLSVKLKVDGTKAIATIDDGNGNILYTQKYDYTNAKVKELTLFFINDVMLLSGEY